MIFIILDAFGKRAPKIENFPYAIDMALIQIRFNTKFKEAPSEDFKWRILVDGEEQLAKSLHILAPCYTTEDRLPTGELKYHLSCRGVLAWNDGHATINVETQPLIETAVLHANPT